MKRKMRKGHLEFLFLLMLFCLLIYSCLPDEWDSESGTANKVIRGNNKELTVIEAEQWYNATNLPVASVRSLNSESEILTKPKWSEAGESRKGDFEVVETPLMVRGSAIFLDAETKGRFDPKKESKKIRNIARMVVIKNLKTGEICNFIMIFVGSHDYLMNTKTFGKNTYLHREPDFDGSVYFYKPGQGFVNGWRYKAGKIVGTLTPGTEEGFQITTRGMYQDCYEDVVWVAENDCWGQSYWDEEFGWGVSSVCQTNYHPEYVQHCQWIDDGIEEEPWYPPSDGGGYEPPAPPKDTPKDPPTPCEKSVNLSLNKAFVSRLDAIYDQSFPYRVGNTEHGFIQTSQGETIHPAVTEAGRVTYNAEQLTGKTFLEWYHTHPTGGPITSLADLKALARQYEKGHIKSGDFTYGVVSEFGCLSLMITSLNDFEVFATLIRSGGLDGDWKEGVDNGENVGTAEGSIKKLAKFLQEKKSGLSILFRPTGGHTAGGNQGNWIPKEVDTNSNLVNIDCD